MLYLYIDICVWGEYLNLLSYLNLLLVIIISWFIKKIEIVNIVIKLKCLLNKDICWIVYMC